MKVLPCAGQTDLTYVLLSDADRDQLIALLRKPKGDPHARALAKRLRAGLKEARRRG